MLNYNHLHYFHMAASEGSVAAAAERLGVTQPTVSEQIRALEKALGVTLFERTTTGLKLTDAGRVAFEHTSVMFRAGERMIESLAPSEKVMPRTLRVGLTGSVARSTTSDFLMPLLAIDDCVRGRARTPARAASHVPQRQFHCGNPPPAAEPRTRRSEL